jgi:hypothetical protein
MEEAGDQGTGSLVTCEKFLVQSEKEGGNMEVMCDNLPFSRPSKTSSWSNPVNVAALIAASE